MENLEAELTTNQQYSSLNGGRRRSGPGTLTIILAGIFSLSLVAFALAITALARAEAANSSHSGGGGSKKSPPASSDYSKWGSGFGPDCSTGVNFLLGDAVHKFGGNKNDVHHYQVVGAPWAQLTWRDAQLDAWGRCYKGLRGHLAEVNNEKENEFFVEQLRAHGAWTDGSGEDAAWIGAAMLRGSDKYEWVEGAHASRAFYDLNTSAAVGSSFVNWAPGEPAKDGIGNCVGITKTGGWVDASCYRQKGFFIVEFEG